MIVLRALAPIAMALALTAGFVPVGSHAAPQPATAMSIRVLSPTHSLTLTARRVIVFRVRVRGLKLDARHVGKGNIAGHGHIQVYLDRIPARAYKKVIYQHLVAAVGTETFTYQASKAWIKTNRGHHRFIFALARNNDVLYQVPTSGIPVTIR